MTSLVSWSFGLGQRGVARRRLRRQLGDALPGIALGVMLIWAGILEPQALTGTGLGLLFSPAVPLVFATLSQMFIISVGDIDLGIGYLVGLVNAVVVRFLGPQPLVAVGIFALIVLGYAAAATLVQVRQIPAIIVTLGASFIWLGLGLVILPIPGGRAPAWLGFVNLSLPVAPLALILSAGAALAGHLLVVRFRFGALIRATGSNQLAVARYGWSVLRLRLLAYVIAASFGILAGFAVTGITGSGDATASANYTLLSIAAVILGGGDFFGGRARPIGATVGALSISLVGSLLGLMSVPSAYQTGAQGLILVLVLAGRVITRRAAE